MDVCVADVLHVCSTCISKDSIDFSFKLSAAT